MSNKILQVLDSGGLYGKEQVVKGLCHLPCDVLDISGNSDLRNAISELPNVNYYYGLDCLKYAIGSGRYLIIHTHDYRSNFYALLYGLKRRLTNRSYFVRTKHGYTTTKLCSKKTLYKIIDFFVLKMNNWNVAVTSDMTADQVIYNGYVCDVNQEKENTGVVKFMTDSEHYVIAAIGRISPEKNHIALLNAFFQLIATKQHKCKLIIFGDGPDIEKLKKIIKESNRADLVYLPGFVKNASRYLEYADIFIQPSFNEGFPITLLEFSQLKNPPLVACSSAGEMSMFIDMGFSYFVDTSESGIFAFLNDLLNKIKIKRKVSDAPNQKRRRTDKMVDYIKTNLNFETMLKAYRKCYEKFSK